MSWCICMYYVMHARRACMYIYFTCAAHIGSVAQAKNAKTYISNYIYRNDK